MAEVKRHAAPSKGERKLELTEVVSLLGADGILRPDDAPAFRPAKANKDVADDHPLATIAARNLPSAKPPHKTVTLELLTIWLAQRAQLPFQRIDPLKVDVTSVTAVMPYNYAKHHNILCVAVQPD